jgi:hypothetical protein
LKIKELVASTTTFYRQQLLKVVVGAIYVIGFNLAERMLYNKRFSI